MVGGERLGVDLSPQRQLEQVARFLVGGGAQAGDLAHVGLGRVGGEVVGQLRGPPRHKAGRERGYCQLEKLHALEQLPPTGFTVICFPVKITAASAGWTRCVAVLP